MKQVMQNYKTGQLQVEEVPTPALKPEGVVVRNAYSLISAGTEKAKVDLAHKSIIGKAKARPGLPVGWTRQYAVDLKPDVEFEIAEEYYTLQLRETINYCKGETSHLNGISSEDSTQVLIDAIYESAKKNTLLRLDSFLNKGYF